MSSSLKFFFFYFVRDIVLLIFFTPGKTNPSNSLNLEMAYSGFQNYLPSNFPERWKQSITQWAKFSAGEPNFKLVAMVIPFLYVILAQLSLMAFGLSNEMEGKDWWFYLLRKYPQLEVYIFGPFLLPSPHFFLQRLLLLQWVWQF